MTNPAEGATPKPVGLPEPIVVTLKDGKIILCVSLDDFVALEKKLDEAEGWLKHYQRSVPEQHAELVKKLESTRTALRNLIDEVRTTFRNGRIPGDLDYWLGKGEEALK